MQVVECDKCCSQKPPLVPIALANPSFQHEANKDLSEAPTKVEKHSWNVKSQDSPSNRVSPTRSFLESSHLLPSSLLVFSLSWRGR